jgi:hypothetical protein
MRYFNPLAKELELAPKGIYRNDSITSIWGNSLIYNPFFLEITSFDANIYPYIIASIRFIMSEDEFKAFATKYINMKLDQIKITNKNN